MINILQILKSYEGNAPLFNDMFHLNPDKYRVHVCYLKGQSDGNNQLDNKVYKNHYFQLQRSRLSILDFTLLQRLKNLIEREQIDIVNCQLPRTLPIGLISSRLAKNKPLIISTVHGLGSASTWRLRIKNWLLYKYVHSVITVSEAARKDVLHNNIHISTEKVVAIQNGLDLYPFASTFDKQEVRNHLFPGINADFWFGTLGRLSEVKNHERLIDAFNLVLKKHPNSVLLIGGAGHLEKKLKEKVKDKNMGKNIFFLGYRNDAPEVLRCLDTFLLPSLREGLPLSMIEAMACGLPVIASEAGGIPEVFGSMKIGFLINPHNVEELSKAMSTIITLPHAELLKLGENSQKRAFDHFQAKRMVHEYEVFYNQISHDIQA
jgi:glycosyltransferase involved in cell wall biosynthesis